MVLLNYQGKNSLDKLDTHYQDIANLLCSYHKIKLIYQQAELSYEAARKYAQEIKAEIDNFENYVSNKNWYLDKFSTMLDRLPLLALNHADYCGELELARITIEINQQNYQDSLQKLLKAGSSLDSWQEFSNQTKNIFLKQIQYRLNYMNPRKELGQQLTASIRGIVEIEQAKLDRQCQETEKQQYELQAKIDRDLQDQIQSVGVGIAAGAIVASTSGLIFTEPMILPVTLPIRDLLKPPPHPFIIALLFSVFSSWGSWYLAKKFIKKKRESQENR
ncbi:MAG: hypothetical protein HC916_02395 [Coleofasciculaceae cyanobacterium SM2_1_6]|nr:hypothetical protein [Coleofasciculaceae cyanobacterium SM2_1_6]